MNAAQVLLTVDEVAVWLRIPKSSIYKLCKEGKIPAVRVGKHWRFDRATVERWLTRAPEPENSGPEGDS